MNTSNTVAKGRNIKAKKGESKRRGRRDPESESESDFEDVSTSESSDSDSDYVPKKKGDKKKRKDNKKMMKKNLTLYLIKSSCLKYSPPSFLKKKLKKPKNKKDLQKNVRLKRRRLNPNPKMMKNLSKSL